MEPKDKINKIMDALYEVVRNGESPKFWSWDELESLEEIRSILEMTMSKVTPNGQLH